MRPACLPPEIARPGAGLLQAILAAAGGEMAPQHFVGGPCFDGLCWRFAAQAHRVLVLRLQALEMPGEPAGRVQDSAQETLAGAALPPPISLAGASALRRACSVLWSAGVRPCSAVGLAASPASVQPEGFPAEPDLVFGPTLSEGLPGGWPGVAVLGWQKADAAMRAPRRVPGATGGRVRAGDRIILTRPGGLVTSLPEGCASRRAAAWAELALSDRIGGLLACLDDIHAVLPLVERGLAAGLRLLGAQPLAGDRRLAPEGLLDDSHRQGTEDGWLIACAPATVSRVLCILFQQGLTQARVVGQVGFAPG